MRRRRARSDKADGRYNEYFTPPAICATCGRSTGGEDGYGFGDFHHLCRRDARGRLIVREFVGATSDEALALEVARGR
jgi:hypothetical protein